jgi:hypothetical protein
MDFPCATCGWSGARTRSGSIARPSGSANFRISSMIENTQVGYPPRYRTIRRLLDPQPPPQSPEHLWPDHPRQAGADPHVGRVRLRLLSPTTSEKSQHVEQRTSYVAPADEAERYYLESLIREDFMLCHPGRDAGGRQAPSDVLEGGQGAAGLDGARCLPGSGRSGNSPSLQPHALSRPRT